MSQELAARAAQWLDELGAVSDEPPGLTRTFLSPALEKSKQVVALWMRDAGLTVFEDQAGNLIGRRESENPAAGTVVCASHLDTVRNAGRFDGAMGVVAGLLAAGEINRRQLKLPYHLEIVGFSDEEGVRFQSTYLGSLHYIDRLGPGELAQKDDQGISVREAISTHHPAFPRPPARGSLLGYVEAHIEQGPVLEEAGLALGVATAIAGQKRARIFIGGKSGHAGTTPMKMRRDALAGAAECVLLIEEYAAVTTSLVATVGDLRIASAASNVIPGQVEFTLDVRDADPGVLDSFCETLFAAVKDRMEKRRLGVRIDILLTTEPVQCSPRLTDSLSTLVEGKQGACPRIVSGAGHDAVALSQVTEVAMLFVRCRDGLSHHPDEFATAADIGLAVEVLTEFLAAFPAS